MTLPLVFSSARSHRWQEGAFRLFRQVVLLQSRGFSDPAAPQDLVLALADSLVLNKVALLCVDGARVAINWV